jgi:uncharacterized protein YndB with AHSA1/START domain
VSDASDGYEMSVTRLIAAPPAKVWKILTERMEEWWCPRPWKMRILEQELRSGGASKIEMTGPNGESMVSVGLYLEVVPERRIIFTDAFTAGWIPAPAFMVGSFEIEPEGAGTRYTGRARHWTEEAAQRHREMGFETGWGVVAEQLAELAEAG